MQFVGNFFELTVRHITFKRLKVGHRVRCSVLYTVFVGEKRREEKGREEKRTEREEEKERRERPHRAHVPHASVCSFKMPSCAPAKRPDVFNMRASCQYTRRHFECTHGGELDMNTGSFFPRTKPCHIPHNHTTTTPQHHNTTHNTTCTHDATCTYTHTPPHQVYTHTLTTQLSTNRDLESVFVKRKVNARICAQSTTDRDLETKK